MATDKSKMTDTEIEQEILDKAAEDETIGGDRITIKLRRPFEWEGNTYTELKFDFYRLTGKDCIAINRELARKNIGVFRAFNNDEYIVRYAARACEAPVGADMINALPSCDYFKIRTATSNFLLLWETL